MCYLKKDRRKKFFSLEENSGHKINVINDEK